VMVVAVHSGGGFSFLSLSVDIYDFLLPLL